MITMAKVDRSLSTDYEFIANLNAESTPWVLVPSSVKDLLYQINPSVGTARVEVTNAGIDDIQNDTVPAGLIELWQFGDITDYKSAYSKGVKAFRITASGSTVCAVLGKTGGVS